MRRGLTRVSASVSAGNGKDSSLISNSGVVERPGIGWSFSCPPDERAFTSSRENNCINGPPLNLGLATGVFSRPASSLRFSLKYFLASVLEIEDGVGLLVEGLYREGKGKNGVNFQAIRISINK